MRQLPHYPSDIPDEPLLLRRIFLPPNSAPPEDELIPLERRGTVTMQSADAFLREDQKRSRAHCVRIETEDGGLIRKYDVKDVIRERLGIDRALRVGERGRIEQLLPELPPL
jgi:hypothetical protein